MIKKFKTIAMGGTFDHFHDGHKQFIKFASNLSERLVIGVTYSQLTLGKPYAYLIEPAEKRAKMVKQFCHYNNIVADVVELIDIYGPTLEDDRIQALIVTEETLGGAKKINDTRLKMRLKDLHVHVAPLLKNQAGEVLHSEQIRAGQVNRHGVVYSLLFNKDVIVNDKQRQFFSKPIGRLVEQPNYRTQSPVAVVGDYCLDTFIRNDWNWWNIGVFDKKQQRESFSSELISRLSINEEVENPAGKITQDLTKKLSAIVDAKQDKSVVFVNGEEDLAAVALVLLLPLDSVIYYGQPNQGMVEMVVTEQLKDKVYAVLSEE
jgi:pantetheine-phosphate adenylyltransferase